MKTPPYRENRQPVSDGQKQAAFASDVRELLECFNPGAKVDVVRLAVQHKRRNRFHTNPLSFRDTEFLLTEVYDLDLEPLGIESGNDIVFCGDADRTSGMIEYGFCFHVVLCLCAASLRCGAWRILRETPSRERGHNLESGHHKVPGFDLRDPA